MKKVVGIVIAVGLVACAGPKPILYPNAHLQSVGPEVAEQDIGECRKVAEAAGATPGDRKGAKVAGSTAAGAGIGAAGGAVGGAILGAPGPGTAFGAAAGATGGFLRGLFRAPKPSDAYMRVVDRCLKERGYEPVGWE